MNEQIDEKTLEQTLDLYTKKNKKYKKNKVKGSGLFDFIKSGFNKVKEFFDPYKGYRPIAQKYIKNYGDWKIVKITAFRKPIMSVLSKVLNFVSVGKFDEGKKLSNYDDLFHLGLILTLRNGDKDINMLVEKNERIDMEIIPLLLGNNYGELLDIPINREITFKQLLENAQKGMGNKYFTYDAFNGNNCQVYTKSLIEYSGFLTPEADKFIYQPLEQIVNKIPKSTPVIAKAVTTLGAFFANIGSKITGRGEDYQLHAVIVKKPISKEELEEIRNKFIKGNKKFTRETKMSYRLRNIPKEKFIKNSFKSDKINKQITLIYGILKQVGGRKRGTIEEEKAKMEKNKDKFESIKQSQIEAKKADSEKELQNLRNPANEEYYNEMERLQKIREAHPEIYKNPNWYKNLSDKEKAIRERKREVANKEYFDAMDERNKQIQAQLDAEEEAKNSGGIWDVLTEGLSSGMEYGLNAIAPGVGTAARAGTDALINKLKGSGKKGFKDLLKELKITQKLYLKIVSKIAKANGYNEPLKLADDGIHKLIYKGIPFGNSEHYDYILYWLTEGEEIANKHRSNYLNRSGKIKGNWKNNPISPNNLSRIITWDLNDKIFSK